MNTTRCASCQAEIFFAKTKTGKTIPLNAKPEKRFVIIGDEACLTETFSTHFTDCPNSAAHRKSRAKKE